MIGKLKGIVDSIDEDSFLLDVGGVCYLLFASHKSLVNLEPGQALEIWTETHVREDHIHLFGFVNPEEKNAFNILQSVKGVGTRMALAILSQMSPPEIQSALMHEDKASFNHVSGVGKKLAERIITELKDKTISSNSVIIGQSVTKTNIDNNIASDAVMALVSLGVGQADARTRVGSILANDPEAGVDELIKLALRNV